MPYLNRSMNPAEQARHCGKKGCPCTHGRGMGDEETCDKGYVDGPDRIVMDAGRAIHYPTVAPCGTCSPAKAEAVALANFHGLDMHEALVAAALSA